MSKSNEKWLNFVGPIVVAIIAGISSVFVVNYQNNFNRKFEYKIVFINKDDTNKSISSDVSANLILESLDNANIKVAKKVFFQETNSIETKTRLDNHLLKARFSDNTIFAIVNDSFLVKGDVIELIIRKINISQKDIRIPIKNNSKSNNKLKIQESKSITTTDDIAFNNRDYCTTVGYIYSHSKGKLPKVEVYFFDEKGKKCSSIVDSLGVFSINSSKLLKGGETYLFLAFEGKTLKSRVLYQIGQNDININIDNI